MRDRSGRHATPARKRAKARPGLSADDRHHLAAFRQKLQLVRDRTRAVAKGYATGFFLHGAGGVGKSYTVLDELQRLKADYVVFNSRMTAKGLYNALKRYPGAVHVLEDMEAVMHDRSALGVLRSALWAQHRDGKPGPFERTVTWSTDRKMDSFVFTGGIVMTSNRPLHDVPELDALKTRIDVLHLQADDAEMRALMRSVALHGHAHDGKQIAPAECAGVAEYVIEQSAALHRPLDMRLLVKGFHDYLLWEESESACHWHDLVASHLKETATAFREKVERGSRAARKHQETEIAREIAAATRDRKKRFRMWHERTGKSEPALYRRLKELGEGQTILTF
jgi:hypothetical protein